MNANAFSLTLPAGNARATRCRGSVDAHAGLAYAPMAGGGEIRFRSFLLLPNQRVLLRDGISVDLGSRTFDLLHVLAISMGSIVPKRDIIRYVWPDTIVEEGNLRVQVAVLRNILGGDRDLIKTIAGRGYLLAGGTSRTTSDVSPVLGSASAAPLNSPPRQPDIRATLIDLCGAAPGKAADTTDFLRSLEAWERLCALLHVVVDELRVVTNHAEKSRIPQSLLTQERARLEELIAGHNLGQDRIGDRARSYARSDRPR